MKRTVEYPLRVVYDAAFAHRGAPIRLSVVHKDGVTKIYGLVSEAVIVPEGTAADIEIAAYEGHNRLRVTRA
jgi:hypothetical protein